MSSAAVLPVFQQQSDVLRPEIAKQRNIDMMQQPKFVPLFPSTNFSPFRTDMNTVGYNNPPAILQQVPTIKPIKNQSQSTTTETYNAMNLNPRTFMNHAQAPYGNARGQVTLISNLDLNYAGKPLEVNNKDVFKDVKFDKKIQHVRPSVL